MEKQLKRKRRSHYITGTHISPKCPSPIHYRSSWEYICCLAMDNDENIIRYSYESIAIPYISNLYSHRLRKYYPDFQVYYKDGTVAMIEVKPKKRILTRLVLKKAEAADLYCRKHNIQYMFWTEKVIMEKKKFLETKGIKID